MSTTLLCFGGTLAALALLGCTSEDSLRSARLERPADELVILGDGQLGILDVRYVDADGSPLAGETLDTIYVRADSEIVVSTIDTDSDGIARFSIFGRAEMAVSQDVIFSDHYGHSADYVVYTLLPNEGALIGTTMYSGARVFDVVGAIALPDATCPVDFDAYLVAHRTEPRYTPLGPPNGAPGRTLHFYPLPARRSFAVFAWGQVGPARVASGCIDSLVTRDETDVQFAVTLTDDH